MYPVNHSQNQLVSLSFFEKAGIWIKSHPIMASAIYATVVLVATALSV